MNTLQIIQRYAIESYATPGSNMTLRSAYRFRRALIAQSFLHWANGKRFDTLIDIGCSTGFLTKKLKVAATRTIAVDANQMVLQVIDDPDIVAVADSLPDLARLHDASADVVVSTDTLYYLGSGDVEKAIDRIYAILRPEGFLVFNDNGNAVDLCSRLEGRFWHVETTMASMALKEAPDFDFLYWLVEAKYVFLRGIFNALDDPTFDPSVQLSEWQHRRLVKTCLDNRWIGSMLWLAWPVRFVARLIWSNDWLLRSLCTEQKATQCLWIWQKR
jgi:SAM-dependent methyltransferase